MARSGSLGRQDSSGRKEMVLKVTSIVSRHQKDIAEKEAKLLSRLSHPSIVKMYDTCYRTVTQATGRSTKEKPQHLILMEYCEGGHALDVCTRMANQNERFDLGALIIAFGQICNAVSYLHAQKPPIVHRDLKPANFLIQGGSYKLCDFGSAVFGHVDLKTPQDKADAEEVISKTTTQIYRAPEMCDLYMAKKLTQATDVWALGCCLYNLAYLRDCFEEGSSLAIINRNYKIPEDNPYGEGLVELIDRMLTVDSKERADMTEVILCLSAVYSNEPLPKRKERSKKSKKDRGESSSQSKKEKVGSFRTDGQGVEDLTKTPTGKGKALNKNSAAYRRRMAAGVDPDFSDFSSKFNEEAEKQKQAEVNEELAFSASAMSAFDISQNQGDSQKKEGTDSMFTSFDEPDLDLEGITAAFGDTSFGGDGEKHGRRVQRAASGRRSKSAARRREGEEDTKRAVATTPRTPKRIIRKAVVSGDDIGRRTPRRQKSRSKLDVDGSTNDEDDE